jgi:hypothetical protein
MKKMTLKVALLSAIVMAVPGIAFADYDAERKAAVAAVDKAKKVGGEWRDIRWKKSGAVKVKGADGKKKKMSYLAAADHYNKAGDSKKAMKYLGIVKFQGEMGYQQAMEQKNAGPHH